MKWTIEPNVITKKWKTTISPEDIDEMKKNDPEHKLFLSYFMTKREWYETLYNLIITTHLEVPESNILICNRRVYRILRNLAFYRIFCIISETRNIAPDNCELEVKGEITKEPPEDLDDDYQFEPMSPKKVLSVLRDNNQKEDYIYIGKFNKDNDFVNKAIIAVYGDFE